MNNKNENPFAKRREVAPVILFAFNRPDHTKQTLEALAKSDLCEDTDLVAFIDGPRDERDTSKVEAVREQIERCEAFRSLKIIQRSENHGLARNIIAGVSQVIEERNRVIVVEDDIVVSNGFLTYMNDALDYYANQPKVWHIGGYNEDIESTEYDRSFFCRAMRCWGWGTWKDRWQHFEKDPEALIRTFSKNDIKRFNLDDMEDGHWSQVLANAEGEINTWAVFWYATIFKHHGLCLNPVVSHVKNIGFDGTGVNCGKGEGKYGIVSLNTSKKFDPPPEIIEDTEILTKLKDYYQKYHKGFFSRLKKRNKLALKTALLRMK